MAVGVVPDRLRNCLVCNQSLRVYPIQRQLEAIYSIKPDNPLSTQFVTYL